MMRTAMLAFALAATPAYAQPCPDLAALETVPLPSFFFGCYGPAEEGVAYEPGSDRFFLSIGTCTDNQFPKAMTLTRYASTGPGAWTEEAEVAINYAGVSGLCHVGDIEATPAWLYAPVTDFDRGQTSPPTVHIVRFDHDLAYSTHWPVTFAPGDMDAASDLAGVAVAGGFLYAVQYQEPGTIDPAIYRFPLNGAGDLDVGGMVRFPIETAYANGLAVRGDTIIINRGDTVSSGDPWGYLDVYDLTHLDPSRVASPIACHRYDVGYNACFGVPNSHAQGVTYQGADAWVPAVGGKQTRRLAPPVVACPGDVTGDGQVNFDDLNALLSEWGGSGPVGDVNADGAVNFDDLNVLLTRWGDVCG